MDYRLEHGLRTTLHYFRLWRRDVLTWPTPSQGTETFPPEALSPEPSPETPSPENPSENFPEGFPENCPENTPEIPPPPGPKVWTMDHRADYKTTWNQLSPTLHDAKFAVGGFTDEAEFDTTGQITVAKLEQLIGLHPTDTILEIGCGVGRVGKILSPRCRTWIGTDISAQMLAFAAQRLQDLNNIQLVELNTVGLAEIPDASVDLVYCTVVFMHLFEWDRYTYIKEAWRVLKPGGRCYFDNADLASDKGWKVFSDVAATPREQRLAHSSMLSTAPELHTYALKAGFENVQIHQWEQLWVAVTGTKPQ